MKCILWKRFLHTHTAKAKCYVARHASPQWLGGCVPRSARSSSSPKPGQILRRPILILVFDVPLSPGQGTSSPKGGRGGFRTRRPFLGSKACVFSTNTTYLECMHPRSSSMNPVVACSRRFAPPKRFIIASSKQVTRHPKQAPTHTFTTTSIAHTQERRQRRGQPQ